MDINLHNYEEYFLSYADGELSNAEKKVVENFVAQNPTLEQEFSLTLSTILPTEDIQYNDVAFLFKKTGVTENLEADMVLHLDRELDIEKAKQIDAFIAAEPMLQKEWSILQQTKLEAERFEFADKQSLYRHEPARIISGKFWKLAAAAVIIGICMMAGYQYINTNEKSDGIAVLYHNMNPGKTNSVNKPAPNEDRISKEVATNATTVYTNNQNGADDKDPGTDSKMSANNTLAKTAGVYTSKIVNTPAVVAERATNNIANQVAKNPETNIALSEIKNKVKQVNTGINDLGLTLTEKQLQPRKQIIDIDLTPRKTDPGITATVNTEDDDNTRILYVDSKILKQTKAGAIFKKINDIIDHKNNLGNGKTIKIANFEIAL